MNLDLLQRTLIALGEPDFRVRQIWRWTAGGASGFQDMTDLPLGLRDRLEDEVPFSTLQVVREARARDGTVKVLLHTRDGRPVEAVLMQFRDGRRSVCLSSQSGCPLTCTFCATGQMRFGRNLTVDEILDQALYFRRTTPDADGTTGGSRRGGRPFGHAVFMGMGEPMLNLDAVLGACRLLPDVGVTPRRTAISTVGWIPGIDRLASEPLPVRLALSLHAAEPALRSELMPVNERYPLDEVLEACRSYYERKRRQVFVEYVMLAGVNDSVAQARQLADLLDPVIYKVNLIPYNPTSSAFTGSSAKATAAFREVLEKHGLRPTVRVTRGREIAAACGQLAGHPGLAGSLEGLSAGQESLAGGESADAHHRLNAGRG